MSASALNRSIAIQQAAEKSLGMLKPRERKIFEMRFGLNGYSPHTLREIGSVMKLKGERIRQIINRQLTRLSAYAGFSSDILD